MVIQKLVTVHRKLDQSLIHCKPVIVITYEHLVFSGPVPVCLGGSSLPCEMHRDTTGQGLSLLDLNVRGVFQLISCMSQF